ncbi:MAG: ATP-binding cassette domain-containing protein [Methanocorpusculum sp.]|nr:ATP-binding cassette domain-containing protein [Methanocorpusculum sp.]
MTQDTSSISSITILPGKTRDGSPEKFDALIIRPGDTLSIVGPTGSGKTALINDIEVFANCDTVTSRKILVNGVEPDEAMIRDPAKKPIAMITQNTKCLADLNVCDFLTMHMHSRRLIDDAVLEKTIAMANEFTGEKITGEMKMSELSGGQTRSLFIADAVVISDTPILLLDEIENAGIFKDRVIEILREDKKAIIFVTHDPYVALLTDKRIVMRNGAVQKILLPGDEEHKALEKIAAMDAAIFDLREKIRKGDLVTDVVGVIA